jgi:NTP-dependent ternary system trypsin peptidase co-occuring protein
MSELLRWETDDGPVVIEADAKDAGFKGIAHKPGEIIDVSERFESALGNVRAAAVSALRAFSDKSLAPDEVSLEFGVKFNVSAGAVIAKTAAEGNLTIRLTWSSGAPKSDEDPKSDE